MTTEVSSLVGLPQPARYARIIRYSHEQYDLILCFSINDDLAHELVLKFEQRVLSTLPFTGEALYELLNSLNEEFGGSGGLQYAGILKNKYQLYSFGFGGVVSLLRNGKSGYLIANSNEIQLVQGRWEASDKYVIATQTASPFLDDIYLRLQAGFSPTIVLKEASNSFFKNSQSSIAAISCVVFEEQASIETNNRYTQGLSQPGSADQDLNDLNSTSETKVVKKSKKFKFRLPNVLSRLIYQNKTQKVVVTLILVAALIAIGTFLFFKDRQTKIQALNTELVPLAEQLEIISATESSDSLQKKTAIADVLTNLQELKKNTPPNGFLQNRIDDVIEEAGQLYDQTSEASELENIPTFFNARDVKSDFIASSLVLNASNLILIDRDTQQLLIVNLATKENKLIDLEERNIKEISANNESIFLLGNELYTYDFETQDFDVIHESDDFLSNSDGLAIYDNFLYSLNKSRRNIYRYTVTGAIDAIPISWLKAIQGLDFETVSDFVVDGRLWLTTNEGEIKLFEQGQEVGFNFDQPSPAINSSLIVYTALEIQKVYVLEPAQSRIVILQKDGRLAGEIKHTLLGSATDFVVDEVNSKIYVLNGSLIQEISLSF